MEIEDPNLIRQRRNLLLTSCGILLYYFADGKIVDYKLPGTGIVFHDKQVLKTFFVSLHIFFIWRYWQYAHTKGKRFRSLIISRFYLSYEFKDFITPIIKERGDAYGDSVPLVSGCFFYRKIDFSKKADGILNNNIVLKNEDFPYSKYKLLWIDFRYLLRTTLQDTTFIVLLFPYFLALFAIIVLVYNYWIK